METKLLFLYMILQKLLKFGLWDCYNDKDTRKPWFKVGKTFDLFKHDSVYDVVFGTNETQSISSSNHKMEFKIIDSKGKVAAEVSLGLRKNSLHNCLGSMLQINNFVSIFL